jgi:hypothetical protein
MEVVKDCDGIVHLGLFRVKIKIQQIGISVAPTITAKPMLHKDSPGPIGEVGADCLANLYNVGLELRFDERAQDRRNQEIYPRVSFQAKRRSVDRILIA